MHGGTQRRNPYVQSRIKHRLGSRIKVHHSLEGTKHRNNRVQRRNKVNQFPNIDTLQPKVESGISSFLAFGTINQRGMHIGIQSPHAKILQMHSLIADIHGSAHILKDHRPVSHLPEIGLQFKIDVSRDNKQFHRSLIARRVRLHFHRHCILRKVQ